MIACIDVDYSDEGTAGATAACVLFTSWTDDAPAAEYVQQIAEVAEYVPGQFYKRELPCALAVLEIVEQPIELIVIDGYVILDAQGTHGMGGYLYEVFDRKIPVIGVAKNRFRANSAAVEVLRGGSKRPLFVTALGIDPEAAAIDVQRMHGRFRLPTLLKRVDRLCRDGE